MAFAAASGRERFGSPPLDKLRAGMTEQQRYIL